MREAQFANTDGRNAMYLNGYTIDIILVAVIIISIIIGRIRGFSRVILGFAASIGCIILAREFAAPVGQWLNDYLIHESLTRLISKIISDNLSSGAQAVTSALPAYIVSAAENMGISINNLIETQDIQQVSLKLASAVEAAFSPLLSSIGFITVFAVCRLVSGILLTFVSVFRKLPVIKTIDKTFGGIVGAAKGLIFFLLLCAAAVLCKEFFAGTPLGAALNSSTLVYLFEKTVHLTFIK